MSDPARSLPPRPAVACAAAAGLALCALLTACAAPGQTSASPDRDPTASILAHSATPDAVLLGELHDAPDHPAIHEGVTRRLAAQGRLAALVIEMAERGTSTDGLSPGAGDHEVQHRLRWDEKAWPWARYGPAIMAAVRASVAVAGGNLPRESMRPAMADLALDQRLSAVQLQRQRDAIRDGHCGLLPATQIAPMTRIQLARDMAMAQTIAERARDGGTVLLVAGAAHVDRGSGVPAHLPARLRVTAVQLAPGAAQLQGGFDRKVVTAAYASRDHCAELKGQLAAPPRAP